MSDLNLNINFGQLIKNVAVDMHGHQVGAEIMGTVQSDGGPFEKCKPVVVIDKKEIIGGFAYLVHKKDQPDHVAIAQSISNNPQGADCLIYNARIIGSDDPSLGVKDLAQARREFGI